MAALVIHTPPGLDEASLEKAAELGPTLVRSDAPLDELLERAGFEEIVVHSVTEDFVRTCERILHERDEMDSELREAEGDAAFEEERSKKLGMLEGVRLGLLERTLYVARTTRG